MQIILRILLAFVTPTSDADAEALQRFAPKYITIEDAREHLWAARVAATIYDVDMDMILAISWHESRFQSGAVGPERGKRVSCGVMQPFPTKKCVEKTLLAQYIDGTRHWAMDWKRAGDVRNNREAILGYAGGYAAIRRCRMGPVLRYKTHGDDLCRTPEVFSAIRTRIRRARQTQPAS